MTSFDDTPFYGETTLDIGSTSLPEQDLATDDLMPRPDSFVEDAVAAPTPVWDMPESDTPLTEDQAWWAGFWTRRVGWDPLLWQWVPWGEFVSGDIHAKIDALRHLIDDPESGSGDLPQSLRELLPHLLDTLRAVRPIPKLPPISDPDALARVMADLDISLEDIPEGEREKILSNRIYVIPGATWIPARYYAEFMSQLMGGTVEVAYADYPVSEWRVTGSPSVIESANNRRTYGHSAHSALELFQSLLNLRQPKVTKKEGTRSIVDEEATEVCRARQENLKELFIAWLWRDTSRATLIALLYRDRLGRYIARKWDGSHLRRTPGMSVAVDLYPHQKSGAWQIIQSPASILWHWVGAGKTATMVAAAMECRQRGLAHRPWMVVRKATLLSIYEEAKRFFPNAKIIYLRDQVETGKNQDAAMEMILWGDYDLLLLTTQQFMAIPLSVQARTEYWNTQLSRAQDHIDRLTSDRQTRAESSLIKKAYQVRNKAMQELAKLRDETDTKRLTFERLAPDWLALDEAHDYKSLGVASKMNHVAGISNGDSLRAHDAHLKFRWVIERGGKGILATGTLITNSLVEIYVAQLFAQPEALETVGWRSFDEWIASNAEPTTGAEITPTGEYRLKTRFRRFTNLDVLSAIFSQICSTVTRTQLAEVLPKVNIIDVIVPPSRTQLEFLGLALERAEKIHDGTVTSSEDNMLRLTHHLLQVELDPRLFAKGARNFRGSKVNESLWIIHQIWRATKLNRGTQVAFISMCAPKHGKSFELYQYGKDTLIQLGIPENEIAFIHDATSDARKFKLISDFNNGTVRILFSSIPRIVGVNPQQRLVAAHDLDFPWRPNDLTQAHGRIERRGNMWPEVWIFRYVTEKLGVLRLQVLEAKAAILDAFMEGCLGDTATDIDAEAFDYQQLKALATGSSLWLEKTNLESKVKALRLQAAGHAAEKASIKKRLAARTSRIDYLAETRPRVAADWGRIEASGWLEGYHIAQQWSAQVRTAARGLAQDPEPEDMVRYFDRAEFSAALRGWGAALTKAGRKQSVIVGKIAGLNIVASFDPILHVVLWYLSSTKESFFLNNDKKCYEFFVHPPSEGRGSAEQPSVSLTNRILHFKEQYLKPLDHELEKAYQEIRDFGEGADAPWPKAEELAALEAQLRELETQLQRETEETLRRKAEMAEQEAQARLEEMGDESDSWWVVRGAADYEPPDPTIIRSLQAKGSRPEWLARIQQVSANLYRASKGLAATEVRTVNVESDEVF